MNKNKLLKVLDELVSSICYQQEFPLKHKQDLANAYGEFKKSCKTKSKEVSK